MATESRSANHIRTDSATCLLATSSLPILSGSGIGSLMLEIILRPAVEQNNLWTGTRQYQSLGVGAPYPPKTSDFLGSLFEIDWVRYKYEHYRRSPFLHCCHRLSLLPDLQHQHCDSDAF